MTKETLKDLQQALEVEKWEKGVATGSDPCGTYAYCEKCDKAKEYPCAEAKTAYETPVKKPVAKKAPAKKKTSAKTETKAAVKAEVKVAEKAEAKVAKTATAKAAPAETPVVEKTTAATTKKTCVRKKK